VQIRLSRDLDDHTRAAARPMTVDEFLARFPEVPRDLREESVLERYVAAFGPLLRIAQKPSPCVGAGGDMEHVFYTRLVNDLGDRLADISVEDPAMEEVIDRVFTSEQTTVSA